MLIFKIANVHIHYNKYERVNEFQIVIFKKQDYVKKKKK